MPTQLRIYTINRGTLHEFVSEWRARQGPLWKKLGFEIVGAWTVEATNQFAWVLRYEGPEDWDEMVRRYFQSEERRSMQPDPARHIARMEQYFVEDVPLP